MEHRWGERMPTATKVRLVSRPGAIGSGCLRDVSLSGAFVQTDLSLPILTRVAIEARLNPWDVREIQEIPACVVRRAAGGIGVEWCEFAPEAVCAWLAGTPALQAPAAESGEALERLGS